MECVAERRVGTTNFLCSLRNIVRLLEFKHYSTGISLIAAHANGIVHENNRSLKSGCASKNSV